MTAYAGSADDGPLPHDSTTDGRMNYEPENGIKSCNPAQPTQSSQGLWSSPSPLPTSITEDHQSNQPQSPPPPTTTTEDNNETSASPPLRNQQPINSTYENWSVRDDSITVTNNDNPADDLAWKIISIVLKGWCITWILFAVLIVSAELFSPSSTQTSTKNMVTVEDGQLLLELSENIVSSCAYTNLSTENGREKCQALCSNHMCCFINDESVAFHQHRYGCKNDPEKTCAAHAGCETLIVSEDEVVEHDANSADMFDVDSKDDIDSNTPTKYEGSSSELELIQQVVTSVCSNDNLHTRHGILECASLCNTSMCCFDRHEIEILNPKVDLILKMENIDDGILDPSAMGTCIDEDNTGTEPMAQRHFCQVHAGCKNILLLGAPPSAHATTNPQTSSSEKNGLHYTKVGIFHKDTGILISNNSNITADQERELVTVCILFGMMIGLSVYLLVYKRNAPFVAMEMSVRSHLRRSNSLDNRDHAAGSPGQEMVEFV